MAQRWGVFLDEVGVAVRHGLLQYKVGQSGTYACPATSGNRIFTKGKETLVWWAVE
jgi:hypothetical protein